MFVCLFFFKALCEIFNFDESTKKREIIFDVTGDQICKGHFAVLPNSNASFTVSIVSKDGGKYFETLVNKTEMKNFSFNVTDNKDLICILEPIWEEKIKKKYADVEIKFETQYDTFKKDVAKQVRVEPATYSLTKIGNIMLEMNNQIEKIIAKLLIVESEHKKMFSAAILLSMVVLVVYVGAEIYSLYQMRLFFKTKKLI